MAVRAVLTLNGKEFDVQNFEQSFILNTRPHNGCPTTFLPHGGELHIQLNTPEGTFISDLMSSAWDNPIVEGELNVYDVLQDMPVRRITFRKALITLYKDRFTTKVLEPSLVDGSSNMQTSLCITPQEMIINKFVRISRNYGWRWIKVKDDELMPQTIISNPEMKLRDAYWIKEDGSQCKVFPIGTRVTLYLVLGEFETFVGDEIEFHFHEKTEEGVYTASVKGCVPEDGIMVVEDFEFKPRLK